MPLLGTRGAASAQGFGEFAQQTAVNYIEDVFSTYLYTGTGSSQTITNGIDLSTKGGLVWTKTRSTAATDHYLIDTTRGGSSALYSNLTDAANTAISFITFNSNGYTIPSTGAPYIGVGTRTYVGWTFREQPKFFDVVTYTGNGANRTIAHNLGSVPGCIIIKRTDGITNWNVYHRSLTNNTYYMLLNTTDAQTNAGGTTRWNSTTPTSTVFSLGTDGDVNANGGTYVAYLFAHDAGGFGASGNDNVISCGSYTGNGSATGPTISLGYEPQWIMIKNTTSADTGTGWRIVDNMRGIATGGTDGILFANSSNAEVYSDVLSLNATGFQVTTTSSGLNTSGDTYIYIAIRRGPMKTPTSGTSVFSANTSSAATGTLLTTNFPVDMQISAWRTGSDIRNSTLATRLTGVSTNTTSVTRGLVTSTTASESTTNAYDTLNWGNTAIAVSSALGTVSGIYWNFRRAPGFMDVVCYSGTGSARTVTHNLGVVPELMIVKRRDTTGSWSVYEQSLGNTKVTFFDSAATINGFGYWNNTSPTSSVFTVNTNADVNASGGTYVAYLFASCPGVSKVGSYTGTGATQTISCGFAARFVLIKRTDSTGNWFVWDTARGMVAGTDPRTILNSIAAESNTNWVYTDASGFQIVTTDASVNASGGSYIYLAIA